ncbi:hypothetical protein RUM43_010835 [Polyplax serrata]|uniref:Uncharacterized protein n=1 Tax=Polyplax serrata TaxID=468196 RepID=A0AAN8P427_POLSC
MNQVTADTSDVYFTQNELGLGTYAYSYNIDDPLTGNVQFKQEERHKNGAVTGSYGYVDANGVPVTVTYIADENGFRMKIEKPGTSIQYFPNERDFFGESNLQLI